MAGVVIADDYILGSDGNSRAVIGLGLADDYILGSDGNSRAVIRLNIDHRGAQTASFSIWRPRVRASEKDGRTVLIAAPTEVDKVSLVTLLLASQLITFRYRYFV